MGIGLAGSLDPRVVQLAVAGTIFYVTHHIIVKSSLFLVGGIAERVSGSQDLKQMGGVLELSPGVAGLFLVAALSLAGMPPFSGFLSKFLLAQAGLAGGNYLVVAISIITGFLTLYSMSKIWSYAFWRERCREAAGPRYRGMMAPAAVLVAFTILMGVWAQPFLGIATRAAGTLIQPGEYIRVVMGAGPAEPQKASGPAAAVRLVQLRQEGR
jgi:multicomponent Na+:H+ antiporter subunit D